MSSHTPEQWIVHSGSVYQISPRDEDGYQTNRIALMDRDNPATVPTERDANAHRIAACINACAGIPTERLERMTLGLLRTALNAADYHADTCEQFEQVEPPRHEACES